MSSSSSSSSFSLGHSSLSLILGGLGFGIGIAAAGMAMFRWKRTKRWGKFNMGKRDLSGLRFVVSGANTGLGYFVAESLARNNGEVVLASRDREKGEEAAKKIRRLTNNPEVTFMKLDLSLQESVRSFVTELSSMWPDRIDCLICNAGVWMPMDKEMKSKDGFEIHFGVNHLGHFLLTKLLMDHLSKSKSGRVVLVSSGLMNQGKLDMSRSETFTHEGRKLPDSEKNKSFAPTGYCDTKLMNALFASELSRRSPESVDAYSLCPGFCATDLGRNVDMSLLKKLMFIPFAAAFMRSGQRGSENILHAALEDKTRMKNGGFYKECKLAEAENAKLNAMEEEAKKLWEISERLTK